VEFLFTTRISDDVWRALVRPAKRLKTGTRVFAGTEEFEIVSEEEDGFRLIRLVSKNTFTRIADFLQQVGVVPLPPYMRRGAEEQDVSTYQTVYAKKTGAVAAPTAGLHFTADLLDELASAGVDSSFVTLHVGIGTFKPVEEEDPREHTIHKEQFELSKKTVKKIEATKCAGGRIIAVGTTVVRVLEHCAGRTGELTPQTGSTQLFIMPGYQFRIVDSLITNFHLPKSTLLMLVSAFAGRDAVLRAYREAVDQNYRFYSYGDAMFIR
jgi:S-adenosylmethionine:tRNA ribosyltransferase-isomerase